MRLLSGRRRQIEDATWSSVLARCPMLGRLAPDESARTRELAERFLTSKSLEGAGGLEIGPEMAASIAAQACIALIGLDLDWYRGWRSVIVYPGDFIARHEYVDEAGVVHEGERHLAGESWDRGPIVLSWEAVVETGSGREWGNVVVHECAHKLDLLDGQANGVPPLPGERQRERWSRVMSEAFGVLQDELAEMDPDDVLAQAAQDPAEFFAVTSEWLHDEPQTLRAEFPDVYTELVRFYRRDPCPQRPVRR